jgi:hypothetical protein
MRYRRYRTVLRWTPSAAAVRARSPPSPRYPHRVRTNGAMNSFGRAGTTGTVPAKAPTAVYSVRIPVERIEELHGADPYAGACTALMRHAAPEDYAPRWQHDVRATAEQPYPEALDRCQFRLFCS